MSKYLSTVLTVRDGLRNARHFEQTQYYDNSFRIECTAVYMYHHISITYFISPLRGTKIVPLVTLKLLNL